MTSVASKSRCRHRNVHEQGTTETGVKESTTVEVKFHTTDVFAAKSETSLGCEDTCGGKSRSSSACCMNPRTTSIERATAVINNECGHNSTGTIHGVHTGHNGEKRTLPRSANME